MLKFLEVRFLASFLIGVLRLFGVIKNAWFTVCLKEPPPTGDFSGCIEYSSV